LKAPGIFQKVQQPLTAAILIIFFSKVLVFCLGYVVSYSVNSSTSILSILMSQFYHWDSAYYIGIAKNWYINQGSLQNSIVFFSALPLGYSIDHDKFFLRQFISAFGVECKLLCCGFLYFQTRKVGL